MRIYTCLNWHDIIIAGSDGLIPRGPMTDVERYLDSYLIRYPNLKKVRVPNKGKPLHLVHHYIYGGVVSSAINVSLMCDKYKDKGLEVFFMINKKTRCDVAIANFRYKIMVEDLLMYGTKSRYYNSHEFENVDEALKAYANAYWSSVVNPYKFYEYELMRIKSNVGSSTAAYDVRKYAEWFEVLYPYVVPPQNIFVPTKNKQYIPFLLWLYKHRGIFKILYNDAKSMAEKEKIKDLYEDFIGKFNKYISTGEISRRMNAKYTPRSLLNAPCVPLDEGEM